MRPFYRLPQWRRSRLIFRTRLVLAGLLLALAAGTALASSPTSGTAPAARPASGAVDLSALARSLAGPTAVAVPIRLPDPALGAIIRPGDRVDVVAVDDAGTARVVAWAASVLAVPRTPDNATQQGTVLVVATSEVTAPALLAAAVQSQLAVSLRPP